MDGQAPACPDCERLRAELESLKIQLEELRQKLNQNSSNSSKPPSSDPPWVRPPTRSPSGRKPGGQTGHPGHYRELLPPERVHKVIRYLPQVCPKCHARLPEQPSPEDPEPSRHQVAELPAVVAEITEHQGHWRTCCCCGTLSGAEIPKEIRTHAVGPKLASALAFMTAQCQASKRDVLEIASHVFGVPLSLGTIANLEQEMSAALEQPHAQALETVRAATVKNVDETSWARGGKLCWLWLAATFDAVAFKIHPQRGGQGLTSLLGARRGILISDRWNAYTNWRLSQRQLCWAHLKRDFQKIAECDGASGKLGRCGLGVVKRIFVAWSRFKAGQMDRSQLREQLRPVRKTLFRALTRGRDQPHQKTRRFSKRLLKVFGALWRFAGRHGVEPTNNHAERLLRRGVLWRKSSFGSHSDSGCHFVERILTALGTLRLQSRPLLDFLSHALIAHRQHRPAPVLLPGSSD